MRALVDFGREVASIEGGRWKCDDPELELFLNKEAGMEEILTSDPQPHLTAAKKAIKLLGGKIIYSEKYKSEPGVVY